jgi:hypothetical protein
VPLLNLVLLGSFLVVKTLLAVLLTSSCAGPWDTVALMPILAQVLLAIKKVAGIVNKYFMAI